MKLSVDSKQRVTTTCLMFLEFYKILMATFLVLFVPQKCEEEVCTITENFFKRDPAHLAALISNFTTFVSVLYFYHIEMKRENWCIKYLDIDLTKPNNYLDDEIEAYPKYKKQMNQLNKSYLKSMYASSTLLVINFGISGTAIGFDYVGTNTITTMVSFFLLISSKLYSAYVTGTDSVKKERALSAYMKTAKTYNTIDEDFRITETPATTENIVISVEEKTI
tara:strand:+ start:534 stop:1199 length:666 start_codon:yes stop_codon:yes gene_type:complete